MSARGGTGEEQVGDVRASDQEDDTDHYQERRPGKDDLPGAAAGRRQGGIADGADDDGVAFIGSGIFAGQGGGDASRGWPAPVRWVTLRPVPAHGEEMPLCPRSRRAFRICAGQTRSPVAAGSQKSGPKIALTPMKPRGAMPMTVNTTSFSRTVRPITSRAPPNRVCQVA